MVYITIAIKFLVPHGLEDTCSRVHVTISEPFEEVLEKIYDGVGCQDVQQKPGLKFKISGVKNSKKMKLQSGADWEGLLEEVAIIGKGKKDMTFISVEIELPADVSHIYLVLLFLI